MSQNTLQKRAEFSATLSQHGYDDVLVLGRERAPIVFTDTRLAIIDYLKENDPDSTVEAVDELGDMGVTINDMGTLARLDIIEYVDGAPRLKHKHVVIEPVVTE